MISGVAALLGIGLVVFVGPSQASEPSIYRLEEAGREQEPGHYAFEVAPLMVPPHVRPPPYVNLDQLCPSLDAFGSFGPSDSLCGDLNQGGVPVNPLGQAVLGQNYPFELIKNKTLQFLARALPVLKNEYESIPKVARFLPQRAHHLLNPTHHESLLATDQMQLLNRRLLAADQFMSSGGGDSLSSAGDQLVSATGATWPPLVDDGTIYTTSALNRRRRRRRRKRSVAQLISAELSPNVSLVVSSAHSSPIRVLHPSATSTSTGESSSGVITKDGYKFVPAKIGSMPRPVAAAPIPQFQSQHGWQSAPASSADQHYMANSSSSSSARQQFDMTEPPPSETRSLPGDVRTSSSQQQQQQQEPPKHSKNIRSSSQSRFNCADSGNGFYAGICQALASLIEGERAPTWFQLARHFGTFARIAQDPAPSFWSLLTGYSVPENERSSSSSSSGGSHNSAPRSSIFSLLGSLLSGSSSSSAQARSEHVLNSSSMPATTKAAADMQQANSSWSGSALTKIVLAGWASNLAATLIDRFAPDFLPSLLSRKSFARRKKPFDAQEVFVDTPASQAAAATAQLRQHNSQTESQTGAQPRQPPTPCPSVEEYISPTFARNYQGAWKYVVQIPHEGYFTQTIQRTKCLRQRCEFTEGVCHESPRWVSLLVAEIYYPNTVFGQGQQVQAGSSLLINGASGSDLSGAQQMATASSMNIVQQANPMQPPVQDPLQMTDSLSTYNHNNNNNLNNNLYTLPNNGELAWDPQQLANLYNYQLLQSRQGLSPSTLYSTVQATPAQQLVAEARSSSVDPQFQLQQQQQQPSMDYLTALAMATIQQNPNLSLQELIASLTAQRRRKKRDLGAQQYQQQQQQQQQQQMHLYQQQQVRNQQQQRINQQLSGMQQRPSMVSASPVPDQQMNEINTQPMATQMKPMMEQTQQTSYAPLAAQPPEQTTGPTTGTDSAQQANQLDCDGHDKLGCYVVRVYYDWFLVNGSCKCWKMPTSQSSSSPSGSSSSSSSSSTGSSNGNSFLRRIFTG